MGVLQRILTQVVRRLRDINTSQRIALLLGGTLVAVSLLWLLQWAASPEMVPLLDQDLQAEEIAQVRSGLELMGEPCEVRGNRVFVRAASHRQALIAQLQQQEKLPTNTSTAFANLIKQSDPWISMEESNRRWAFALQQTLEQVLRQFSGVKSANVFLNLGTQSKSFTRTPPPSSASITLAMKQGAEVPRSLALAAARLVSGAVAGLPPHNVEVVDAATGRVALDWDAEQDVNSQLDRKLIKEELRYAEKIRQQVPDPKALVSVQVALNPTTSNIQTEQPLKGVTKSERTTRQETTRGRSAELPGVQANVGLAASSGGTSETNSQETSETEAEVGLAKKVEATPPGEVEKVTAAISLSYGYLEGVFRRANPTAAAPADVQIEEIFQRERTRLLAQVVQLVKPQVEENVAISRYYDSAGETAAAAAASAPGALNETLDLVKSYGRQSGLALLAVLSLGLMLRLARKSDTSDMFGLELGLPKEAIEAARAAAADVSAFANSPAGYAAATRRGAGPAGLGQAATVGGRGLEAEMTAPVENVAATEGMLVAQEVDPGTVQTRKMIDQVAQMVESDPAVVAALIEQWVQRNEQYRDEAS
jgi:flagellar biosynthesis/type III secretory pathway M-ring protein FliF/YscJ